MFMVFGCSCVIMCVFFCNEWMWILLIVIIFFYYVLNFVYYIDNLDLYFKNGNLFEFFVDIWIKLIDKKMVYYFV